MVRAASACSHRPPPPPSICCAGRSSRAPPRLAQRANARLRIAPFCASPLTPSYLRTCPSSSSSSRGPVPSCSSSPASGSRTGPVRVQAARTLQLLPHARTSSHTPNTSPSTGVRVSSSCRASSFCASTAAIGALLVYSGASSASCTATCGATAAPNMLYVSHDAGTSVVRGDTRDGASVRGHGGVAASPLIA